MERDNGVDSWRQIRMRTVVDHKPMMNFIALCCFTAKYFTAYQQLNSRNPYFCCPETEGAVAQSVEQRTENPCVGGSIPPHTTAE